MRRLPGFILLILWVQLHAQAYFTPWVGVPDPSLGTPSGPTAVWYGTRALATGNFSVGFQGTLPWYNVNDWPATTMQMDSPAFYPLSMTSGYHNATEYSRALLISNGIRYWALLQARAKNKKEGADPLLGKGPASLSFWQWLKVGEMALKTYGKVASIVKAINAGTVTIDVWKLIPKISVLDEGDPSSPLLVIGLVPSDQGVVALTKQLLQVNDPRYYLGNLVKFDDLNRLVPSLAVKPSFYGAWAHLATSDPTSRNVQMVEKITRNVHDLRISLSMLNRQMVGQSHTLDDIKRSRFSTAMARQMGDQLQAQSAQLWDGVYQDARAASRFYGPGFSGSVNKLGSAFEGLKAAERAEIERLTTTKAADTWRAKAVSGDLTNITVPLETDEYLQGVKHVQDMVQVFASDFSNFGGYDSDQIMLGLATADAWTNKLINDECRALRQIYAMRVERTANKRLAPYIAASNEEIQDATHRLQRLERQLADMQKTQQASTTFLKAGDIARIIARMDVTQ